MSFGDCRYAPGDNRVSSGSPGFANGAKLGHFELTWRFGTVNQDTAERRKSSPDDECAAGASDSLRSAAALHG